MSPVVIGLIGIIAMLTLLFMGVPVAIAMFLVGFSGIATLTSFETALPVMARTLYNTAANYPYMVIPLFVLMGSFAGAGGLVEELYNTFEKWFRKTPGALAAATIASSAAFSAVSGSSVATAAAMSKIAYPEMKKHGYSTRLTVGSIAGGGTLGFLIPPSLAFVVYGMITEQSVGKLLVAGIVPGVILAVLYIIMVVLMVKLKPSLAPMKKGNVSWKERLIALINVWEVVLVFAVVIGGIYLGWFSPGEASAIGGTLLLIIVLIKGRLNQAAMLEALEEALSITTMVIFLMAGAYVFTYFLGLTRIPVELTTFVANLEVSPYVIMGLIVAVFLVLGCFIDVMAMIVLTVPVVFPLIKELGFDPIYFGVVCVLMMNAGLITPPLGLNLFTVKGCAPDCRMEDIYMGAIPFVLPIIIVVFLITVFPGIALFLPEAMF